MKVCPTCKRRYADSLQFCLEDGTVLEQTRDAEPTLVDPQATLRLAPRQTNPPSAAKRGNMLIFVGVASVVIVAVIAIVAVLVVIQFGSRARGPSESNSNTTSTTSAAREVRPTSEIILETNNQVGTALTNADTDALSRLLADDYRFVSDAGLTLNKAEVLLLMRTGNLSYQSLKSINEKVEVNSDSTKAELTAAAQSKGQLRHQTFTDTYFYRNAYEKRSSGWQLVSGTVWHRQ